MESDEQSSGDWVSNKRPELPGQLLDASKFEVKFQQWRAIVDKMHATTRFTPNDKLTWAPLRKPLRYCTIALVSTAGVRLRTQAPFELMNEQGDATLREIPGDISVRDLVVEHSHYDTTDANVDPNVVFPLDRVRELATEGAIGSVAPLHIGMMGWNPDGVRVKHEAAPDIARRLVDTGAEAAVLTPG
jgi:D-proline reductase (dithiol) PrdB